MDTDNSRDVIEWLQSPEGENWSRWVHNRFSSVLVVLKDDEHEDMYFYPVWSYEP